MIEWPGLRFEANLVVVDDVVGPLLHLVGDGGRESDAAVGVDLPAQVGDDQLRKRQSGSFKKGRLKPSLVVV